MLKIHLILIVASQRASFVFTYADYGDCQVIRCKCIESARDFTLKVPAQPLPRSDRQREPGCPAGVRTPDPAYLCMQRALEHYTE